MSRMKPIGTILGVVALIVATGCEVNRADDTGISTSTQLPTNAAISIPGPYSIAPDGSVIYTSVPRPNGHLLGTRSQKGLTGAEVLPWIERTSRNMGGNRVYVRSIIGPYLIDPDYAANSERPNLYDVVIEVWEPRADAHDHS